MELFSNLREVSAHLKAEGWSTSQATTYRHGREGKLKPDKGKNYSLTRINRYAARFLMRAGTKLKIKDEELARRKATAEADRIEELGKLARFKRQTQEGKYLLKADLYLEMAARAAVLESEFKSFIMAKAASFIELVRGDQKYVGDLMRIMEQGFNECLNQFASPVEYQVEILTDEKNRDA